jgi:hypothetical protein
MCDVDVTLHTGAGEVAALYGADVYLTMIIIPVVSTKYNLEVLTASIKHNKQMFRLFALIPRFLMV